MAKEKETGIRRVWGILLLSLCLFISLSLFSYDWRDISFLKVPPNFPPYNLIGPIGAWLSYFLFMIFGISAYIIPFYCLIFGIIMVLNKENKLWLKVVWSIIVISSLSAILDLHELWWTATCYRLNISFAGGIFSNLITRGLLVKWLSPVGTGILVWSIFALALTMFIETRNIVQSYKYVIFKYNLLADKIKDFIFKHQNKWQQIESEERQIQRKRKRLEKTIRKQERMSLDFIENKTNPETNTKKTKKKLFKVSPNKSVMTHHESDLPHTSEYKLPPLSLLDKVSPFQKIKGIKTDTGVTSRIITETLSEFGIEGEIMNIERGPVVTRYELLPAPGIRVERISGLSNNLALSLKATSVRVQAPIPGKGVVGIEVPNSLSKSVFLREVFEGEPWRTSKAKLPLILGKDVGGHDLIADLASMPHLLIAGATGAGKTVCMNSILAALLMARTPDELRLLLVDPKIVEFSVYNHLPHLVVPIITNPKKVSLGLRWAINEMEKRYKLFAKVGVRNIDGYNNRKLAKQEDLFETQPENEKKDEPPARVPYIVIIIDELADLMMSDQADIENCIARLAQLSRAVGIHMILSTQRPSVNVITGTIKANFPARIAFQVAQRVDSRTILDTIGADKLLGRGDMLFLPPGTSKLIRAQGAMTSDEEIRNIVNFIKEQAGPSYEMEIKNKIEKHNTDISNGADDTMLSKAIEIIRETRRASTSSLQRRLRIGYTRAARIMDILEEQGIVGPPRGSDPREILIDLDGEIPDNYESDISTETSSKV